MFIQAEVFNLNQAMVHVHLENNGLARLISSAWHWKKGSCKWCWSLKQEILLNSNFRLKGWVFNSSTVGKMRLSDQ